MADIKQQKFSKAAEAVKAIKPHETPAPTEAELKEAQRKKDQEEAWSGW